MKRIIIIGSGFGGLATAALLAKKGFEVTVVEKNSTPGGRAQVFEQDGFKFDMGPSWYLMPDIFEKYFAEFDTKPQDFFDLKRIDPNYRVFFSPIEKIDIHKNPEDNYATFEKLEPGSSEKFKEMLKVSEYSYKIALNEFVYKNFNNIFQFIRPTLLIKAIRLNILKGFDNYMKIFFKSSKLRKIFEYTVVFLGGSPKNTPALYSIMTHVDFNLGVWYPMGGMGEIHKALIKLGQKFNVRYLYNHSVEKIVIENNKAIGVQVNGEIFNADIVISNADYPFTELNLLEEKYRTYNKKYWDKKVIAPSTFLMYLGIEGKLKNLLHHNLFFADKWEEHFEQIYSSPSWPHDPSYYICCPSKTDESTAPKDHENVFVLVPIAPELQDTPQIRAQYEDKILNHMENLLEEKFRDRIKVKRIFTINDYKQVYNAYKGTALGLSHNLIQSAVFRPANRSKKVKNLYYVGQFTTPGVGVPMSFISAQLVTERIIHENS